LNFACPKVFPIAKIHRPAERGAYADNEEWFLAKGREVPHGPEIPGAGRRRPAAYQIYLERGGRTRQRTRRLDARRRELLATNGKPNRKPKSKSKSMAA